MHPKHLAFDIETIPLRPLKEYSDAIRDKIKEKIDRRKERDPDFDYDYFASIHGDFGKVICLSMGYIGGDGAIHLKSFYGDDEADILKKFNEIITQHNGIFLHYNGLNFDVPFILQRMAHHRIVPANRRFTDLRRFSINPHTDVMMTYYNWDMQKILPLGILAELYDLVSPKEDLSGDKIYEKYQKGKWDDIKRYCEFDTATVLNLWWQIMQYKPAIPRDLYIFS